MNDKRYVNGIDFEAGEYWVVPSRDNEHGMSRDEAEALVRRVGDWPWRMSDATRAEFGSVLEAERRQ